MGRLCTICMHADRADIEAALDAGWPLREIAADYGTSKTALHLHWRTHVAVESVGAPVRTSETSRPQVVKWGLWVVGIAAVLWLVGAVPSLMRAANGGQCHFSSEH